MESAEIAKRREEKKKKKSEKSAEESQADVEGSKRERLIGLCDKSATPHKNAEFRMGPSAYWIWGAPGLHGG